MCFTLNICVHLKLTGFWLCRFPFEFKPLLLVVTMVIVLMFRSFMVGGGNTVETNSANEFSFEVPTSLWIDISSEKNNK